MLDPTPPQRTILVVDDDPIIQAVIERMLERAGYRVLLASDSGEALAVLAAEPSVVVATLDQQLPSMTGTDLVEVMRDRHPSVRTVIISGNQLPVLTTQGPDRVLSKPFREAALLGVLEELSAAAVQSKAALGSNPPK